MMWPAQQQDSSPVCVGENGVFWQGVGGSFKQKFMIL